MHIIFECKREEMTPKFRDSVGSGLFCSQTTAHSICDSSWSLEYSAYAGAARDDMARVPEVCFTDELNYRQQSYCYQFSGFWT